MVKVVIDVNETKWIQILLFKAKKKKPLLWLAKTYFNCDDIADAEVGVGNAKTIPITLYFDNIDDALLFKLTYTE